MLLNHEELYRPVIKIGNIKLIKSKSMSRLHIDNLDTKILQMLVDNGRKPFLEIARECGVSGAAIHQRIAKLQATNILEGPVL